MNFAFQEVVRSLRSRVPEIQAYSPQVAEAWTDRRNYAIRYERVVVNADHDFEEWGLVFRVTFEIPGNTPFHLAQFETPEAAVLYIEGCVSARKTVERELLSVARVVERARLYLIEEGALTLKLHLGEGAWSVTDPFGYLWTPDAPTRSYLLEQSREKSLASMALMVCRTSPWLGTWSAQSA